MKFGAVPIAEAAGAILAHGEPRVGFKKGRALTQADIGVLDAAGLVSVTVARLEPGDVPEDEAAARLARAIAGPNTRVASAFTGRSNIYAHCAGLAQIDKAAVDAVNAIHESVTVATLPPFDPVNEGSMLATVKIIPQRWLPRCAPWRAI